jgi:phosphoglycerol transferase MdoB-like AlkP superfamily enzyme
MFLKHQNSMLIYLKRVLFSLFLLSLTRILFILYLCSFFSAAPWSQLPLVLFCGILFDIQAIAYFLAPFHLLSILPNKDKIPFVKPLLHFFFVLGNSLMLLLNLIDFEFYKIKTRRSGSELFSLLNDPSNPVISYIYNYWWLSIAFSALIFAIYKLYPKDNLAEKTSSKLSKSLIYFFLIAGFWVIGARGGFYVKPLRSFDAARFVDPSWVSACINSPTQLLTSINSKVPKKLEYMSEQECRQITQPIHNSSPSTINSKQPNVVLIVLESFGRDYCGFLNKEPRFTPFLDSLSKLSLVFPNAYSSGTTSMESIPAIFASVPSLLDVPYINSAFQSNKILGVHHYLSQNKYDCSFYYGTKNGSMGFDNFLKISGPIQYYGLNEYPKNFYNQTFDGKWGIWDEDYLDYYAKQLNEKQEPFFSSVFTLTSHDPYKIPEKYNDQFKGGELPIYQSVEYTDYALSTFFQKVWKSQWFKNTIFIITADHPSHSVNEYFYTPTGKYEIPLMIYAPGKIEAGWNDSITASHPDIMPTILSLTGVKESFFSMGKNLLDGSYRTAINSDYGIAQLIDYPYCIRLFPNGSTKMYVHPKYVPNKKIRYKLTSDELILKTKLEKELKAKLQLYNNSLLDNQLYYKTP